MDLNKVRKIGVIDSGKGGQLVGDRLKTIWPHVEIFQYIPPSFSSYSNMSLENLFILCDVHVEYLEENNVDFIVVGCMTLSTNCLSYIKHKSKVKVYDVYSNLGYLDNSYTILATENTIKSGKFNHCVEIPCGHLSGFIQNKEDLIKSTMNYYFEEPNEAYKIAFKSLLKGFIMSANKTFTNKIILGCTHYPLEIELIKEVMGDVIYLDPVNNLLDYLTNKLV